MRLIVHDTCITIVFTLQKKYIDFPSVTERHAEVARGFQLRWSMMQCLGSIDARHIPVMPLLWITLIITTERGGTPSSCRQLFHMFWISLLQGIWLKIWQQHVLQHLDYLTKQAWTGKSNNSTGLANSVTEKGPKKVSYFRILTVGHMMSSQGHI